MKFRIRKYTKEFWDLIMIWNKAPNDYRVNEMYDALEYCEQIMFDYHKEFKQNAINKKKIIWKTK
jgi:hypothetical protein